MTTEHRTSELGLVGPVVGLWFVLWLTLLIIDSHSSWSNLLHFLPKLAFIAFSGAGLAMSAFWCCLFGEFGAMRIAITLLLITAVARCGVVTSSFESTSITTVGVFLVAILTLIPGWGCRRVLHWRICHFNELGAKEHQFSILSMFQWTASAALVITIVPFFFETFAMGAYRPPAARVIAMYVLLVLAVPMTLMFTFLTLVGRFSTLSIALWMPFLSLIGGFCHSTSIMYPQSYMNSPMYQSHLWCSTIGYMMAGYLILAAVCYVRSRGIYLRVGFVNHRQRAQRAHLAYLDVLRRRIQKAKRRLDMNQVRLDQETKTYGETSQVGGRSSPDERVKESPS